MITTKVAAVADCTIAQCTTNGKQINGLIHPFSPGSFFIFCRNRKPTYTNLGLLKFINPDSGTVSSMSDWLLTLLSPGASVAKFYDVLCQMRPRNKMAAISRPEKPEVRPTHPGVTGTTLWTSSSRAWATPSASETSGGSHFSASDTAVAAS